MERILESILIISLLISIGYLLYMIWNTKEQNNDINGVKLGDVFKLLCEIDEQTRLYLDTVTKIMYLSTDEGITPILNEKGKPRKYEEFLSSIRGKDEY